MGFGAGWRCVGRKEDGEARRVAVMRGRRRKTGYSVLFIDSKYDEILQHPVL